MNFFNIFLVVSFSYSAVEKSLLDVNENYRVQWEIVKEEIFFELTVKTLGYIGFGLSLKGGMKGSDMITAGVYENSIHYIHDRFGEDKNVYPILDQSQDIKMLNAFENGSHTFIKFSRKLDTCDEKDLKISDNTLKIIWCYGETDEISYHKTKRGGFSQNLIDGIAQAEDLSKYKTWNITNNIIMPKNDTVYWCSYHKAPHLDKKHHIIGFAPILEGIAVQYTHHMDLYSCILPPGKPLSFFQKHVDVDGYDCYYNINDYPRTNCEHFELSWSISGRITLFSKHVGMPFGDIENEFYMLELHYDNPDKLQGLKFRTGLKIFYTEELREHEVGTIQFGQCVIYSHLIPPNSKNFVTPAHCPSECTKHFPKEGIKLMNVLLHSHHSGRKIKLRAFRNGTELPWIENDENFDFGYQQNRHLNEEFHLLPNDHLTLECTYDTTWKKGKATIGGLSTRDEMCMAFILYYPLMKNSINDVGSIYSPKKILKYFGIQNVTFVLGEKDPIVQEPLSLKGMRFTQVVESVNWTDEKRNEFQKIFMFEPQYSICKNKYKANSLIPTTYPKIDKIYVLPKRNCFK